MALSQPIGTKGASWPNHAVDRTNVPMARAMNISSGLILLLFACAALPAWSAEYTSLNGATLVDARANDGDSFVVHAGGRELHLRLYHVDCLETTHGDKAQLERIREQQRHFGLADPGDVVRFGKLATDYVKRILAKPFVVHTRYARALGRSKTGRFYAYLTTHGGRDLGESLVEQGLARVYGKSGSAPDGRTGKAVRASLLDLQALAMLSRSGIWAATDAELLVKMRKRQRDRVEELKEFGRKLAKAPNAGAERIDVNTASSEQLQRIPGVGPVFAKRIIAGRPYRKVGDLLKVRGIGRNRLETLRPHVTTGGQ